MPSQDRLESPTAEQAYLFRHALLRDAAYDLQLPADRAQLHGMALEIVEALMRGPPPGPVHGDDGGKCAPHPIDDLAAELAEHARAAGEGAQGAERRRLHGRERLYTRRAAERAGARYELAEAARHWQRLAELAEPAEAAEALRRAGTVLFHTGRLGGARALFARALALADGLEQRDEWCLTRLCEVLIHSHTGEWREAETGFNELLHLARRNGLRYFEGRVLGNYANLLVEMVSHEKAVDCALRALEVHRELGKRRSEGVTLGNLGTLYMELGRLDDAEANLRRALEIHRQAGNRRFEGLTLGNLAQLHQARGLHETAERCFLESMDIQRQVGFTRGVASVLGNYANLLVEMGRPREAEQAYARALTSLREVGDRRFEGIHSCSYACCLLALGKIEPARGAWQNGRALLKAHAAAATFARHAAAVLSACRSAGVEPFEGLEQAAQSG